MLQFTPSRRLLALLAALALLLLAFVWLFLRAGPLAPSLVTETTVESRPLHPALFGIGTVEARYTYRLGPTVAARVRRVEVDVGDRVTVGQLLGEMDPVDLDARLAAEYAAQHRAESSVIAARAQIDDAQARRAFATAQVRRYEQLLLARTASEDTVEAKRQEAQVAEAGVALAQANLESAEQDLRRVRAEREALARQRANLRLVAPVAGLVVSREAEPGSTVVAGQSVIEVIDPAQLWVDARFDQLGAGALRAGLPARLRLRSRPLDVFDGVVERVEPRADAVTEELLAKIVFSAPADPLPSLGEMVEIEVGLAATEPVAALPNAALHRQGETLGVWRRVEERTEFTPVTIGVRVLDGWVEIRSGLAPDAGVILHSQEPPRSGRRVQVVEQLPGVAAP